MPEFEITYEFDSQKSIFHLTAEAEVHITSEEGLNQLCNQVCSLLTEFTSTGDRCYMVVDLNKFIIEPELFESYGIKIQDIQERFLYNNGLIRYGYRITRLTIKMSQKQMMQNNDAEQYSKMFEILLKFVVISHISYCCICLTGVMQCYSHNFQWA